MIRQASREVRLDGQRPPAGRAPGTARVAPDPPSDVKTDLMVGFLLWGKHFPLTRKRGAPVGFKQSSLPG